MPITDQGIDFDHYTVIPRTLIFLTHHEYILLLKGSENKRLWAGFYNGVGGHVEQGEDALSAAHRELLEETGLIVPGLWLCGIVTVDTQTNPGVCIFIFTAESNITEPVFSKDGNLEWINISQLDQIPIVEDLKYIIPKIIRMKSGDLPFFAHSSYDVLEKIKITFR